MTIRQVLVMVVRGSIGIRDAVFYVAALSNAAGQQIVSAIDKLANGTMDLDDAEELLDSYSGHRRDRMIACL